MNYKYMLGYKNKLDDYMKKYTYDQTNKRELLYKLAKYSSKINQKGGKLQPILDLPMVSYDPYPFTKSSEFKLLNKQKLSVGDTLKYHVYDISGLHMGTMIEHIDSLIVKYNSIANKLKNTITANVEIYNLLSLCLGDIVDKKKLRYENTIKLIHSILDKFIDANVKKENVAENTFEEVIFIGDIHGNKQTAINLIYQMLNGDGTMKYNVCFTGDYVDRGIKSLPIFMMIVCLSLLYPDKVVVLRGNHEDPYYWIVAITHSLLAFRNQNSNISTVEVGDRFKKLEKLYQSINTIPDFKKALHDSEVYDCLKMMFGLNGTKFSAFNDVCNTECTDWGCESNCKTMVQNIFLYINSGLAGDDASKNDDFCELMNKIKNAMFSIQPFAIINVHNTTKTKSMKIFSAHGGIPIDMYNKKNISEVITYLNEFDRRTGCIGSDSIKPYCRAMWVDHHPVNTANWAVQDENPLMERADSYIAEVDASHGTSIGQYKKGTRDGVGENQTTYMAIKFDFDLIIRGHEAKPKGFEFTHARVLTNHGRPVYGSPIAKYNGSICLIDYSEIIFLTFEPNHDYETGDQFKKYMNYTD